MSGSILATTVYIIQTLKLIVNLQIRGLAAERADLEAVIVKP